MDKNEELNKMIEIVEDYTKDEYSTINEKEVKLTKTAIDLLRYALENKLPFFAYTYQDHDDSIELLIQDQEYIVLFRQEGVVVTAKSLYIYDDPEEEIYIEEFLKQFKA